MPRHCLTFRGEDREIPAGYGKCTRCERLLVLEEWLESECPMSRETASVVHLPARDGRMEGSDV